MFGREVARRPGGASLQGCVVCAGGRGNVVRPRGGYRVGSARLRGWNYGSSGWYFVTVCTREFYCWLGEVLGGEVRLSEAGEVVADELRNTEKARSDVVLDRYVVMPNHLHAIIVIENKIEPRRVPLASVESRLRPGSLGSVVGQFKSVCTKRIRANGLRDFAWQTRYHDHIIRNQTALANIRTYITQNPTNWTPNKNNPSDNAPNPVETPRRDV